MDKKLNHVAAAPANRPSPDVAVCIPSYNGGRFLLPAVRSVLAQSVPNLSVIVVDDGSTDDALDDLANIQDSRLRVITSDTNAGMVSNWNRSLALADGTYVMLFHQDDEMLAGALSQLVAALEAAPSAGFAFGGIETIDQEGHIVGGHWAPSALPPAGLLNGRDVIRQLATVGNFIPCQTVLARLDRIRAVGEFDSRLAYTPDLAMWLRLAARWDVLHVANPVVRLRRHAGQVSSRFLGTSREVAEVRRAFEHCFEAEQATLGPMVLECRRSLTRHLRRWSATQARAALARHRPASAIRILMEGWC